MAREISGKFELASGVFMDKEVPVVIYQDGKRFVIGTGSLDEQGIFTTNFNQSPEAKDLYDLLTGNLQFGLPVTISEVTCRLEGK